MIFDEPTYCLGFDLGSRTGVVGVNDAGGLTEAHIVEVGPNTDGWDGLCPDRASRWVDGVDEILRESQPSFLAYEKVRHAKGRGATIIHGLEAILIYLSVMYELPIFGFNVSTIKKVATGKGNATKSQMALSLRDIPLLGDLTRAAREPSTPGRSLPYTKTMVHQRLEDLIDAYWVTVAARGATTTD